MTEFILKNLIEVLGGISVLVTGLSAFLGKVWSSRIMVKEQAKFATELQEIKDLNQKELQHIEKTMHLELQRKDHFHQISKATYEMNFEKKVNVYTELLNLKNKYFAFKNESPLADEYESIDTYFSFFIACRRIIETQKLYVSDQLASLYDTWYEQAISHLKQAEVDGYNAHGQTDNEQENWMNIDDAQSESRHKLVTSTFDEMEAIFSQIENDIKIIRVVIGMPLTI